MKVNIYYGGRGVLDDPTQYVIHRIEHVLSELRVEVHRYNIYENRGMIATLPQTLKGVDGIILATTVEWLGIGGYMNEFLDAMWLYGDKERIAQIYMQPVVMSTTYGEREGLLTLENAWEILGGLPCAGLCGYVDDPVSFEMNKEYAHIIEKKAENLYRTISQRTKGLPTSNQAVTRSVLRTSKLELTPQESEQLSQYASDDNYVKKQREDIEELSNMFRGMMGAGSADGYSEYITELRSHFIEQKDFKARYSFMITGKSMPLIVDIKNDEIECRYANEDEADIYIKIPAEIMLRYVNGQITIQRAFGVGDISVRGDFRLIRKLDEIFKFI